MWPEGTELSPEPARLGHGGSQDSGWAVTLPRLGMEGAGVQVAGMGEYTALDPAMDRAAEAVFTAPSPDRAAKGPFSHPPLPHYEEGRTPVIGPRGPQPLGQSEAQATPSLHTPPSWYYAIPDPQIRIPVSMRLALTRASLIWKSCLLQNLRRLKAKMWVGTSSAWAPSGI